MTAISYQLYCSRNFPPLSNTLSMLAKTGYTEVEGYGGLYDDPDALAASLAESGLHMPTGHFGLDMVEGDPKAALRVAKAMNMEAVIVPHVAVDQRPTDAAGWAAFGKRLAEAGKPIQDAGYDFGWHNHDFEFADLGGADLPQDFIAQASDSIKLELDLGWVMRGGHDPVEWIKKYAGKIIAVHIKDIAPAGECVDEDGWADVGHGKVDWAPIKAAIDATGVKRMVAEHDNPNDDTRFATRSLAAMSAF